MTQDEQKQQVAREERGQRPSLRTIATGVVLRV